MLIKTIEHYRKALSPYQENRDYIKHLCEAMSLLRIDVKATVKSLERHYCGAFYVSLYENNDELFNLLYESMMLIFSDLHNSTLSERYQENCESFYKLAAPAAAKPSDVMSLPSQIKADRNYQAKGFLKKGRSQNEPEDRTVKYHLSHEAKQALGRILALKDYIKIFRGARTNIETERFIAGLEYNLYHVASRETQVRAIKAHVGAWLKWMRNVYGEQDQFCYQVADLSSELLLALEASAPNRVVH